MVAKQLGSGCVKFQAAVDSAEAAFWAVAATVLQTPIAGEEIILLAMPNGMGQLVGIGVECEDLG